MTDQHELEHLRELIKTYIIQIGNLQAELRKAKTEAEFFKKYMYKGVSNDNRSSRKNNK